MSRYSILCVLFVLCVSTGYGQVFNVDDLSNTTNYFIFQSSSKKTFISSTEGLNVYDGIHNKVYGPNSHNLYDSNIQSNFFEDNKGHIWFSTYEAIHRYVPSKDDFDYYFLEIAGKKIKNDYRVIGLQGDTLCIHTENHLVLWDIVNLHIIKAIYTGFSTIRNGIFSKNTRGKYYVAAYDTYNTYLVEDLFGDYQITVKTQGSRALYGDSTRCIIGTDRGELIVMNTDSFQVKNTFRPDFHPITSIVENDSTSVSFFSGQNRYRYNFISETIHKATTCQPKISNTARTIPTHMVTPDSTLWVCVPRKGIYYTSSTKPKFTTLNIGSKGQNILPRFIYKEGAQTLIFSRENGIYIFNDSGTLVDKVSLKGQSRKDQPLMVYKVFFTGKNGYLIFTNQGILKYVHNKRYVSNIQTDYRFRGIQSLTMCEEDSFIITDVNTHLTKLFLNGNKLEFERFRIEGVRGEILTTLSSIGDNNYLLSINEKQLAHIHIENCNASLVKKYDVAGGIYHALTKRDGCGYFICNTKGLFEIDECRDTIVHHKGEANSLAVSLHSVYSDREDHLWVNSNKAIFKYDPKTQETFRFSKENGIGVSEFFWDVKSRDTSGNIYLGGIGGGVSYLPESINVSEKPSHIIVSDFKINDTDPEEFGASKRLNELLLPYDQNTLSFSFHALDFKNPKSTRVKYMLEGLDKDYILSTTYDGFARYANLPAGEYTLKLMGSNSDGVWNKKSKDFKISITPPFWQRPWFKIAMIFLAGGIAWLFIRAYYTQQLREKDFELREQALIIEKQMALEEERTRIAGEMHDDLGGGLTNIKFLSQKLRRKMPEGKDKETVSKIIKNTQTLVGNMSEIIWAMNSRFDTLDSLIAYSRRYAQEYMLDHDINVQIRIKGITKDVLLSGEKRRHIFLIVKEALHNAVKHAQCDTFSILFSIEDELKVTLSDNGIGLPEKIRLNANGLSNMKKRVKAMDGELVLLSAEPGLKVVFAVPL